MFSYILVSVNPLYLIAKEIYPGDIRVLIDPDQNPHTFQLTPSSMRIVKRSDMLVVIGGSFEEWLKKIDGVKICRLSDSIGKAAIENPHVWLDPVLVQSMSVELEKCLEKVYPNEMVEMRMNLLNFLKNLSDETIKIYSRLSRYDGTILELRPALYHFVDRFLSGSYITVVGQSQPSLSPRKLKEILRVCKGYRIRAIIIERNSSEKIAYPVIKECKLRVVKVDILGSDASSYTDMLEEVSNAVEEALK